MADTLDTLKKQANLVRYASASGENTAERVGRLFAGILENISDIGSGSVDIASKLDKSVWDAVFYTDEYGNLRVKTNLLGEMGISGYKTGEGTNLPSIYDGMPIDNITLYWDNGVLKSKGTDGMDEGKLKTYLDTNAYINNANKANYFPSWALATNKPSYAWSEISNKPTTLDGYGITDVVTLNTAQAITGAKDFTGGLSVNGGAITYDTTTKGWKLTGNLLVTGGITAYGDILTGSVILDALPVDSTLSKEGGVLSVVGGHFLSSITVKLGTVAYDSASGIVSLPAYPTTLPASDVSAWAKASNKPAYTWSEVNNKPAWIGSDKPVYAWTEIGNKPSWIGANKPSYIWTEIGGKPAWIGDNKPSYTFSEIGGKPATLSGYGITDAVTLNTAQTITGAKNFTGGFAVNGCAIVYDAVNKAWKLTGNLLVTGGITAYGDILTGSAILDALPVDSTLSKEGGVLSVVGGGFLSSITVKLGAVAYNSANGIVSLPSYPTTLPASDVSAWAKAAGKPAYTWGEIGGKPSTLSGYGITDALSINGNAVSAAKLQNARTIWGQSFDGTNNVAGDFKLGTAQITAGAGNMNVFRAADINTDINAAGNAISLGYMSTKSIIMYTNSADVATNRIMALFINSNGNVGIRNSNPSHALSVTGNINASSQFISDVATGVKPISVLSTTLCNNLNADLLDGYHANNFPLRDRIEDGVETLFRRVRSDGTQEKILKWTGFSIQYQNYELAHINSNVASATKLQTARSINGTNFDGTGNIVTSYWGTARNFSIVSSNGSGASSAVSVNGSGNVSLYLPSTITASLSGNASTATTLQTARTIWGQSFRGDGNVSGTLSGVADISMSGNIKFSTGGYHAIQDSSGRQVISTNNGNTYVGAPSMSSTQIEGGNTTLSIIDNVVITNSHIQSTKVFAPTYSITNFLNASNANIGLTTNGVVSQNTGRNILSWIDTISGIGYITRYTIGSYRANSGWGRMILSVGNNDAGSTIGASLVINGDGTVTIEGNLVVTGGVTQYATGVSPVDTFTSNILKANNCLLVGSSAVQDAPERMICCYKNASIMYINLGNNPSAANTAELSFNYVGNGSGNNYIGLGFYGGTKYGMLQLYASGANFLHGSLTTSGTITPGSDMRRKTMIRSITGLTTDQIANAPLFDYYWKDINDGAHTGTSAQYWQNVLPNTVRDNGKSGLSLDYNGVNIAGLITVSREIVKLKRENEELRQEINKLKERAA